jgi:hypothetical protein
MAARTSRFDPSEIGLMPMPEPSRGCPSPSRRSGSRLWPPRAYRPRHLEAGVDVLGVLPEDHHVDLLGVEHRGGHPGEPAHRAQADVEVENLAQRDVERAEATADRRGEWSLDADQVGAEGLDGLLGEPVAGLVERLLAGQDLLPLATVLPCLAAAASRTSLAAGQMSTPVPSPSMNGMIGLSVTWRAPSGPWVMRSGMPGSLPVPPQVTANRGRRHPACRAAADRPDQEVARPSAA